MNSPSDARAGLGWALVAYSMWGLIPIYWKQLASVSAMEVLAHRVIWSVLFTAGVLAVQGRLREVFRTLIERALLKTLLLSTALIATNWGLFIWAVSENRVTEASLGYYINPLLNVVLARIFLGERLKGLQLAAV
ncbi:MAG TPA: EamA family transporter, partial [Polyangiaceae bacterium]|nr:EamA family transporter [Polyangiaceae bacterium]